MLLPTRRNGPNAAFGCCCRQDAALLWRRSINRQAPAGPCQSSLCLPCKTETKIDEARGAMLCYLLPIFTPACKDIHPRCDILRGCCSWIQSLTMHADCVSLRKKCPSPPFLVPLPVTFSPPSLPSPSPHLRPRTCPSRQQDSTTNNITGYDPTTRDLVSALTLCCWLGLGLGFRVRATAARLCAVGCYGQLLPILRAAAITSTTPLMRCCCHFCCTPLDVLSH